MTGAIPSSFLWGLFCACSWTWCIGMYLPRLCIERWGLPGFLAFAIPNVIGCAGFGYVLRNAARSKRLVAEHPAATVWFSVITIAFHMFFAVALVLAIGPWKDTLADDPGRTIGLAFGAMAIVFGGGWILSALSDRAWLGLSALLYAGSIVVFTTIGGDFSLAELIPAESKTDLFFIGAATTFGFLLCPYLDLTFHRALQRSPSHHAFGVFGAAFAVMIVMTIAVWFRVDPLLDRLVLGHLVGQGIFTVGAHLRELNASPYANCPKRRAFLLFVPWAAGAAFALTALGGAERVEAEAWYLRFLVFYGLVFPLYVLLFVGPVRTWPRTPRTLTRFAAVALLASPFYEAGYLHDATWLLAFPAVALVIWLARATPKSR